MLHKYLHRPHSYESKLSLVRTISGRKSSGTLIPIYLTLLDVTMPVEFLRLDHVPAGGKDRWIDSINHRTKSEATFQPDNGPCKALQAAGTLTFRMTASVIRVSTDWPAPNKAYRHGRSKSLVAARKLAVARSMVASSRRPIRPINATLRNDVGL
jgi:hypothetical protein